MKSKKEISVLDKGFVRLVDSMGDDAAIVQSARVSYGKGTKKFSEDRVLIRYLIRNKHTTPLEMVTFKFHVKAPLFVIRQWHRHRTWSYNEMSGRYSEMPEDCYVPKEEHVTTQDPNNKQGGTTNLVSFESMNIQGIELESGVVLNAFDNWDDVFSSDQKEIQHRYKEYLQTGMRRELARINLPLAQYSEMYAKVDLHNLFHFLRLRMDSHAQFEIREYANALYELIKPVVPVAAEAFEEYYLGSLTLNKKDQEFLAACFLRESGSTPLQTPEDFEKLASKFFENKREKSESIAKITKVLNSSDSKES
jgi:thymidylate synthase (FAD)